MAVLILNNQPINKWITGPPIGGHLGWLQVTHTAHQVWSGPHEIDLHLLQKPRVSAQVRQDVKTTDTSGIPPCLERKLTRRNENPSPSRTNCCKAPEGTPIVLGVGGQPYTDHSDEGGDGDEAHLLSGAAGQFEFGEYPPRVRWLRERDHNHHHHSAKLATAPVTVMGVTTSKKRARNDKTVTVPSARLRSLSSSSPSSRQQNQQTRILRPPLSGSSRRRNKGAAAARSRGATTPACDELDDPSGMEIAGIRMTSSCEGDDGSKRRRRGGGDSDSATVIIVRPVTATVGGLRGSVIDDDDGLPSNANGTRIDATCCGEDAPHNTGRVIAETSWPFGLRRSPRLRIGREQ